MVHYFDFNATTPLDSRVVSVISHHLSHSWGNPSSGHVFGRHCKQAVEDARAKVGAMVGSTAPSDIVFTSGGTEANNLVFHSIVEQFSVRIQRRPL